MWVLGTYNARKILLYGTIIVLIILPFCILYTAQEDATYFNPFYFKLFNSQHDTFEIRAGEIDRKVADRLGVDVTDIYDEQVRKLHLRSRTGVLIKKVYVNSSADQAGLQSADIIRGINKTQVASVRDYQKALKAAKNAGIMEMRIARSGTHLDVNISMSQAGD